MGTECIIPLDGLKAGHSCHEWHLDRKFFDEFDNQEIISADLEVSCMTDKTPNYLGVDCAISGKVTVACDRCLADLDIPVDTVARLSVKYADVSEPVSEETDSDREMYFIPNESSELDLRQIVYDFVCVSMPLQKVHEDGKCDPDVEKFLSHETETDEVPDMETPFASLKNLLDKN